MTKKLPATILELNSMLQQKYEQEGESLQFECFTFPQCKVNGVNCSQIEEIFDFYSAPVLAGALSLRALINIKYLDEPDKYRRPFAIFDNNQDLYAYEVALNNSIERQLVEKVPNFLNIPSRQVTLILGNEL